jgi:hypothetical protein
MGIKPILIKPFAKHISASIVRESTQAVKSQENIFHTIIGQASKSVFGIEHQFDSIRTIEDYQNLVPLRDYESIRSYIDRIIAGEADVLWPGRPRYFAKTSGTTSGAKYIPITKQSLPNHFTSARNAVFHLCNQLQDFSVFDGKMIFLSGSPELEQKGNIACGRLSGIVNHVVPAWLRRNQLPSYKTNCIEDWDEKIQHIIEETLHADMRLISGIPPWVQDYFERLLSKSKASKVKSIFKNFSLFVYGGVNYAPYSSAIEELIGQKIQTLETFPASEGFFAFQDTPDNQGLLLISNSGIFYEFIPLDQIHETSPQRLWLQEVELGVQYALIINSNAGLWGYKLGDTIEFVSKDPYRIKVTGRTKHFISAFGEHVISKEVETAMIMALGQFEAEVIEFTVAPYISDEKGMPSCHQWFIEFRKNPKDLSAFSLEIDRYMCEQNIYYRDLRQSGMLASADIRVLEKGSFGKYMKSLGKLGGQNKVPRLSNDRNIVDHL